MKEVSFLENLAEKLLEGSFSRALKPKLQPVQIAKALAREMERSQVVAADGPLVANRYRALLHPADFAGFAGFQASMERELADYLHGYAARHGLRPLSAPSVQLLPAEPPAALGKVVVEATLADVEPEPPSAPQELPADWQGTAVMQVVAPEPQPRLEEPQPRLEEPLSQGDERQPPAFLVDEEGQSLPLTDPYTSIGRAVDNDLVLETGGVSRHHARIVWESGRYFVLDLGSTNGTFVAGSRVTREPLAGGEELSFGGAQFTFRLVDPRDPESRAED